jgi:hypothetical protein
MEMKRVRNKDTDEQSYFAVPVAGDDPDCRSIVASVLISRGMAGADAEYCTPRLQRIDHIAKEPSKRVQLCGTWPTCGNRLLRHY